MRHRLGSRTVLGALLLLWRTLVFAQPAAALNADYWRVGWRTPLGDGPHIYEFLIRANRVTGVYVETAPTPARLASSTARGARRPASTSP